MYQAFRMWILKMFKGLPEEWFVAVLAVQEDQAVEKAYWRSEWCRGRVRTIGPNDRAFQVKKRPR